MILRAIKFTYRAVLGAISRALFSSRVASVAGRVGRLSEECDRLSRQQQAVVAAVDRRAEEWAAASSRLEAALADAQALLSRYEQQINEVRAEMRVQQVELDCLAAAYQRQLKRYDAETAIEVRRQVAADIGPRREVLE